MPEELGVQLLRHALRLEHSDRVEPPHEDCRTSQPSRTPAPT
jgi:hypothetical protein